MEEAGMGWEQSSLLNELTQGKDLAKQLQTHLNPSSSTETRLFIVEKILRSYEKALSMLNSGALAVSMLESPPSAANSTLDSFDHKDISKKRKTMSKWTEHVRVCAGSSMDVPLEDGYGWRKYGQKDILGTNYPRAYYRCTHRHSQGCLATKQVQRSDDDPTLFEVTYRGRHTCIHSSRSAAAPVAVVGAAPSVEEDPKEKPEQPEVMVLNFETELKVKAESSNSKEEIFPSFPFPYASTESEEVGNDIFPESMVDNNLMGSFSPAFISPATSESNYFSVSPCHMGSFGIVQTSESDLAEIISGSASVTNSPIGDLDFTVVFDTNFSFDNLDYFS